jgi:hypothetical protein
LRIFTPGTALDTSWLSGSNLTDRMYNPPQTMAAIVPVVMRNRKRLGIFPSIRTDLAIYAQILIRILSQAAGVLSPAVSGLKVA